MLYWLTQWFYTHFHVFRVFQYLTFRSILAALTALLVSFLMGPKMIQWLTKMQIGQTVRDDGPESHLSKAGTPTMGGALVLFSVGISGLLWTNLSNHYFWLAFFTTMAFGLIGWVDDYKKLVLKNAKGLSARQKYFWQSLVGLGVALIIYFGSGSHSELLIPFFKNIYIELGWFFPVLTYFVIVGCSNAVNLTDGLDGLAILPTVMIAGALGIFAYATSNSIYAHYLALPYLPEAGELTVYCSGIVGAGLGFLWFNAYPAQVFMGDVGSLALGAALGVLAVLVKQEIVLFVMGGLFVAETFSVILQVGYFKYSGGKRIFKMAPLHHHFELKGWPEPKVTVRFWIITVILVLMGLATLKLR